MDHPKANTITHLSLCTGYGGIDLGLSRVLRDLRTIAYCEREAFAAANLVSKIEQGALDAAPVWTDLKTFPWADFHGLVDILSGGYPCQPFSKAGLRRGKEDPRHLFPWILDGISIMRPGYCFFENVEGHIERGLQDVLRELERVGYETAWGMFTAEEVGYPHQRRRVFILAKLPDSDCIRLSDGSAEEHPTEARLDAQRQSWASRPAPLGSHSRIPARPGEHQRAFEPRRTIISALGRDVDGLAGGMVESERIDRLHLLGNGVVPQVAAVAFYHRLKQLHQSSHP